MHTLKDELMNTPRMLPSFTLTEKDLPEIKEWKVGKKYVVEMEIEMTSLSKNEYDKSLLVSGFKIHKIGEKEIMSEDEKSARRGRY